MYGSNGEYLLAMSGSDFQPFGQTISENYWILGVQIMRNYYVLHDVENMKIGFIHANQDAAYVNTELVGYIFITLFIFLGILISCCVGVSCCYKRR